MKKLLIVSSILLSLSAFGQTEVNTNTTSVSTSSSLGGTAIVGCISNCASTDAGNRALADAQVQSATISAQALRDVAGSGTVIKNTPSVNVAPLTASNDTCMGSTSGSVNIAGLGIGGGSTWVDTNCKMLKNSRELWNMGMRAASLALMCSDPANKEALELTGFECPQTKKAREEAATYTDPYVKKRLGL